MALLSSILGRPGPSFLLCFGGGWRRTSILFQSSSETRYFSSMPRSSSLPVACAGTATCGCNCVMEGKREGGDSIPTKAKQLDGRLNFRTCSNSPNVFACHSKSCAVSCRKALIAAFRSRQLATLHTDDTNERTNSVSRFEPRDSVLRAGQT